VFPTAKDTYNISYWTVRTLLACLLFANIIKINQATWKFNGSSRIRVLNWVYATVGLLGVTIYWIRTIKLTAFGNGAFNNPIFYLRTARMFVVWQCCEYMTSLTVMVMIFALVGQEDKGSRVKCLLDNLVKSWDQMIHDNAAISLQLRKNCPGLF
jgi:hypothetical protein